MIPQGLSVDLNSDLGEGYGAWRMGDDEAMLGIVSSANVACGFHAGDPAGILRTLKATAARGVAVGAHVAYPDLVGFGRRPMAPSPAELVADVIYQIGALQGLARAAGTRVRYVKPHGALYHAAGRGEVQAEALLDAMLDAMLAVGDKLMLVAQAGTPLVQLAQARGLRVIREAFADRAYEDDGSLRSRQLPGAVLQDPGQVAGRMLGLLQTGTLEAASGRRIAVEADSICVHGDSPGAVEMARQLRQRLEAAGIAVRPFAD